MKSRRPYLVRALYEWIVDNHMTPYLLVHVDAEGVEVPKEFVVDGRIVLNASDSAVRDLRIENDAISFSARFAGMPRNVYLPMMAVLAIYARENGQGMFFDGVDESEVSTQERAVRKEKKESKRPELRIVK
ncbi:MAG TPA: ClpXP protease specificity-enhancing factor [Pseudomonadales bacterium]